MPVTKRTFRSYNPAFGKDTPGKVDRKRTVVLNLGSVNSGITRDIFRAFSEVLIRTISVVVDVAVAANANSFWKFDIQNKTEGSASLFTQTGKSLPDTTSTGLNGLSANVAADLYADTAFPGSYFLQANDVLQIVITKTGSPANLSDLLVQIEFEITGFTTTTSTSSTTSTTTSTSSSTTTTTTTTTTTSTTTTIT